MTEKGNNPSFAPPGLTVLAKGSLVRPQQSRDGHDLMSRILVAFLAAETKGMGEFVRKANTGIRRHGIRATVLSKKGLGKRRKRGAGCDIDNVRAAGG